MTRAWSWACEAGLGFAGPGKAPDAPLGREAQTIDAWLSSKERVPYRGQGHCTYIRSKKKQKAVMTMMMKMLSTHRWVSAFFTFSASCRSNIPTWAIVNPSSAMASGLDYLIHSFVRLFDPHARHGPERPRPFQGSMIMERWMGLLGSRIFHGALTCILGIFRARALFKLRPATM
ncbi:hypothetical protein L228DRAFT_49301 [Xylona heveae TC161]|uniref:Uncharacterized protein n=1 Tax=Xylona heveae (strain CBS 132557 / TC161) TaxID=1328760 RepID=A0A164ZLE2_XYLHT|nr:hypothetical protein L228DRAFT_49301 [Xylona heveae TC161]KZF19241.1 hypothetical protein L228DRAFT_49301 [Xylona heveae TC161]